MSDREARVNIPNPTIIRCRDCKYWGGVAFGEICRYWSVPVCGVKNHTREYDFCSYAERKEEEE